MNVKLTSSKTLFILLLVFGAMQAVVAFLTHSQSLTHEESMWQYIGHNWLQLGQVPYEGGVDNKSPLIFLVFGVSDYFFGLNYWFPRLLGIACQLAGMFFLYRLAARVAGRQAALISVTIYGLSLMWRTTGGKLVSFTETYAVTLMIISIYYYVKADGTTGKTQRQLLMSGLFSGFAVGWRITAAFGILAVLIYAMIKNRKSLLPYLAGIFISISLLMLLMLLLGINLQDLYVYAWADNFGRGSTTDHPAAWQWERFTDTFIFSELAWFYPGVIGYFFMPKRRGLLTLWLACEITGIVLAGIYARPHFKQILPALSIINGIALSYFISRYALPLKYVLAMIVLVFFPKISEPFTASRNRVSGTAASFPDYCALPGLKPDERAEMKLGSWIKSNTSTDETVLVAGFGARVQAYCDRRSPTVYFNVTQTEQAFARLRHDLEHNKPDMVLIPTFNAYKDHVREDMRRYIEELVKREYVDGACLWGYRVYRKK